MDNPNFVILGRLGSVYGVRGWIRIHSFTDPPEQLFEYPDWLISHKNQWIQLQVSEWKPHGDSFVLHFTGIDDRDQVSAYTNDVIAIPREQLPETSSDEFYVVDLIGLSVTNLAGIPLGTIIDVLETGSNDVFVVEGEKRHLIPYLDQTVKSINLEQKSMTVDWDDAF